MSLSQTAMEKLKEEYAKIMLEKAQLAQQQQQAYTSHQAHVNAHQQAAQHTYISNNTGGYINALNPYAQQAPITIAEEKLDEGAWDVPVSQLVDLWIVRYGSKWVNSDELDEFYHIAARRLRALNKLETHFVNSTDVYRIVE